MKRLINKIKNKLGNKRAFLMHDLRGVRYITNNRILSTILGFVLDHIDARGMKNAIKNYEDKRQDLLMRSAHSRDREERKKILYYLESTAVEIDQFTRRLDRFKNGGRLHQ